MAIPFAWVKTEKEAEDLIVLNCVYNSKRRVYQVHRTWNGTADGIREAVRICRHRFGFPERD